MDNKVINSKVYLRLRHLTAILGRNFNLLDKKKDTAISIYFALNLPAEDSIGYFYRSLYVDNNLNPSWEALDFRDCSVRQLATKSVVITVFASSGPLTNTILFEVELHFSGLDSIGTEIPETFPGHLSQENLLIFQFGDRYYISATSTKNVPLGAPETGLSTSHETTPKDAPEHIDGMVRVDKSLIKSTYKIQALRRLFSVLKAKGDSHHRVSQLKEKIDSKLFHLAPVIKLKQSNDVKHSSILLLRTMIQETRDRLALKKLRYTSIRDQNTQLAKSIQSWQEEIESCVSESFATQDIIATVKSEHQRVYQGVVSRKRYMLQEICDVLSIDLPSSSAHHTPDSAGAPTQLLAICGLPLANTDLRGDVVPGVEEKTLGGALGMVGQLVNMVSCICEVPLRYPMRLCGSRCRIRDNVVPNLPEKEREFPLYLKGTTDVRLKYGYYLLNLNIIVLRGFFGIPTSNQRATLWNLKTLIEIRLLGQKASQRSSVCPVPTPLPISHQQQPTSQSANSSTPISMTCRSAVSADDGATSTVQQNSTS